MTESVEGPTQGDDRLPLRPSSTEQPAGRLCACGHPKQAHEHYRRGTDCALCSCQAYHRPLRERLAFWR